MPLTKPNEQNLSPVSQTENIPTASVPDEGSVVQDMANWMREKMAGDQNSQSQLPQETVAVPPEEGNFWGGLKMWWNENAPDALHADLSREEIWGLVENGELMKAVDELMIQSGLSNIDAPWSGIDGFADWSFIGLSAYGAYNLSPVWKKSFAVLGGTGAVLLLSQYPYLMGIGKYPLLLAYTIWKSRQAIFGVLGKAADLVVKMKS